MRNRVRQALLAPIRKIGLRYEHLMVPAYYVPYAALDGLATTAPIQCDFEVTFRCNMYCDMCPQVAHREQHLGGAQIRHPPGRNLETELTTEEIQGAISTLADGGTKIVQFTGGEAFLRKDMCDILEHSKRCGLHVALITNGTLITSSTAPRLVTAGVDAITFSLDGPPDLHNRIRHLASGFDGLRNGISLIQLEKASQNKERPNLSLSAVIQQQNQARLAEIVDAANNLGIKNLNFNFPFYTTPMLEAETWAKLRAGFSKGVKPEEQSNLSGHRDLSHELIRSQLSEARRRGAAYGIKVSTSPNLQEGEVRQYIEDPSFSIVRRCFYPWKAMRVNAWGDVYPCSVDVWLGNIRERSILQIWNGEKYRRFRRALKENDLFPQCAKCCVLTDRNWNRLPKLAVSMPASARPIVQRVHRLFR